MNPVHYIRVLIFVAMELQVVYVWRKKQEAVQDRYLLLLVLISTLINGLIKAFITEVYWTGVMLFLYFDDIQRQ